MVAAVAYTAERIGRRRGGASGGVQMAEYSLTWQGSPRELCARKRPRPAQLALCVPIARRGRRVSGGLAEDDVLEGGEARLLEAAQAAEVHGAHLDCELVGEL